jgi:hypothetical protein
MRFVILGFVPDYFAFDHIDNVFCDICCVVGYTFQVSRNRQQMKQPSRPYGMSNDTGLNLFIHFAIESINLIVGGANPISTFAVHINK